MMKRWLALGSLPTGRVEAFIDGVLAIVITLLVLDLKVPNLRSPTESEILWALIQQLPKFFGYVLSFLAISVWWVAHHQFFHVLKKTDRGLLWLNCLFLLFVVLIPFPTAMLGQYPDHRGPVILYGLIGSLTGGIFFVMRWYAFFVGKLADPGIDLNRLRSSVRRSAWSPLAYGMAAVLGIWWPLVSKFFFLGIPLYYFLPGQLEFYRQHKD